LDGIYTVDLTFVFQYDYSENLYYRYII